MSDQNQPGINVGLGYPVVDLDLNRNGTTADYNNDVSNFLATGQLYAEEHGGDSAVFVGAYHEFLNTDPPFEAMVLALSDQGISYEDNPFLLSRPFRI